MAVVVFVIVYVGRNKRKLEMKNTIPTLFNSRSRGVRFSTLCKTEASSFFDVLVDGSGF
jgi:hypothetical protein